MSAVNLDVVPKYLEAGESFDISCSDVEVFVTTISRNGVTCVAGCYAIDGSHCDQSNRQFDINCDTPTNVIVTVSPAVENDFTTWSCSFQGKADTGELEHYGMPQYQHVNL